MNALLPSDLPQDLTQIIALFNTTSPALVTPARLVIALLNCIGSALITHMQSVHHYRIEWAYIIPEEH